MTVARLLRRAALLRDLALRTLLLGGLSLVAAPPSGQAMEQDPAGPGAIAQQAVAEALGVAPAEARVISTEARDFPDGSLGCPQPGMAYAQVITPGYRVILEVNGRRFDVRVAGDRGRICYRRQPPAQRTGAERPTPKASGEAARKDLAARLGIPVETVTLSGLHPLKPGETLRGCGEVCASHSEPFACGLGVRLQVADRDYDYVAVGSVVRPCPEIAAR